MIDFGVARAFGRVAHTSPGGLKGKIDYMSPEQASAEEVDHRADVFALGVVLWEALTGRRLFRRETELATMRAIVDDPIPHPSEMRQHPARAGRDRHARAAQAARTRASRARSEMAAALERFAFSQRRLRPMQVAAYTKSLFAAEYLQWRKTATAALDLEVEKPHAAAIRRWRASAPNRRPPGRRWRCGRASSWQDGRSEMRSASGRSRSRSSPSQGQGNAQRGSQSAYSQPRSAGGQPAATGAGVGAQARSHLAVRGRRRAAGDRRRRRLDADAAPGDRRAGQPARRARRRRPPIASTSSRRRRPHRSRRSRARPRRRRPRPEPRPSCRPRRRSRPRPSVAGARARRRVMEGALPSARNPSRAAVTNASAPARRPKPPTATTTTRRRRQQPTRKKPTPSRTDGRSRPTRGAARFRVQGRRFGGSRVRSRKTSMDTVRDPRHQGHRVRGDRGRGRRVAGHAPVGQRRPARQRPARAVPGLRSTTRRGANHMGEVVADFRELVFMNSSCLKEFVRWIAQVEERAEHYRIRFLSDPDAQWQSRSLQALRAFAPEPGHDRDREGLAAARLARRPRRPPPDAATAARCRRRGRRRGRR